MAHLNTSFDDSMSVAVHAHPDYRDSMIVLLILLVLAAIGYAVYEHSQYSSILRGNAFADTASIAEQFATD